MKIDTGYIGMSVLFVAAVVAQSIAQSSVYATEFQMKLSFG